ncbi:MAG: hypothetical protein RLT05_12985 [Bauldia litoralis]
MIIRFCGALLAAASLSGCFTSDAPLIDQDEADFPFEAIVYQGEGRDEVQTLIRKGDAYVVEPADIEMRVRFLAVGDDTYVALAEGSDGDETAVLYTFLKVDMAAMTAESFASMAPEDGIDRPGFSDCGDRGTCVDDLDAYIAYAQARVAAGDLPDIVYTIISAE